MRLAAALGLALAASAASARADLVTSTFENVPVPSNPGFIDRAMDSGGNPLGAWTVDGGSYSNYYGTSGGFDYWGGWAFSNVKDATTAGFTNQYASSTGGGAGGSANYGVSFGDGAYINLADGTTAYSMDVTNTTYAYLSMKNGDGFAKKFTASDYFRLVITGYDGLSGSGGAVGSIVVNLALGTDILNTWKNVDLTGLGDARSLSFSYESSDTSTYQGVTYINTPTYFAMDDFTVRTAGFPAVPEPSAWILMGLGAAGAVLTGRRRAS